MRSVEIIGSYRNIQTVQQQNKYVGHTDQSHILLHPAWSPLQKKESSLFELKLTSAFFRCFLKFFFKIELEDILCAARRIVIS